jgi:hypothetical protein
MASKRDKQRLSRDQSERDQIEVEPGAENRLVNILKKALNTPPPRHAGSQHAPTGDKPKRKG